MSDPRVRRDSGRDGDEPRPLAEGLDRLMRSLRLGDARSTSLVVDRWREMVGDRIADHARPVKLDDRRLLIEVDDPAWATQLRFLEADIVTAVREAGGLAVDRIEVRVRGARRAR